MASFSSWRQVCPALGSVSAQLDTVRAELDAIAGHPGWFCHLDRPDYEHDADWRIFPLYLFDRIEVDHVAAMPATSALLAGLPGLRAAVVSRLGPGDVIRPHRGPPEVSNFMLRAHLGLDVPEGAVLTVDGEERALAEGQWLVFDDLLEHHAANPGSRERVVLLCDLDRPGPLPLALSEPPWEERVRSWPRGWEVIGARGRWRAVRDFPGGLASVVSEP